MVGTYSNTALAWSRNVKEAALYFEYVIPMDREDNSAEELFAVLPESMTDERFKGVIKELWDVYHLYWESQSETSYFYEPCIKWYQAALKTFEERYSLTELPKFGHSEPGISLSNDEIPYLALQNLQIIDPSQLTWDLVLEFRKDPDAVNRIQRLRRFLESNYTNKSRRFIEDDLAIKTEDYQSALKKWGFETKIGIIEILLKSKTAFDSIAASLAFALSGDMVFSATSFTTGILIETSSVAVELNKRSKEKDELKRNNPYDYQMKKSVLLNVFCAFFLCFWAGFLINSPALASTVCLDGTCDYTSIRIAIENSSPGETIVVGPGTYSESIHLINDVKVVSTEDDSTMDYIDGGYTTSVLQRANNTIIDGGGEIFALVTCPGGTPTLDGFTIQNISGDDTFLVTIGDGSPIIKNNIIRNNLGGGHSGGIGNQSQGSGSPSPTIENNLIHNVYGPGVGNGPDSYATIRYNEIWDCKGDEGPGIGLWGYANPTIVNNTIFNNSKAGIGSYHSQSGNTGLEAGGFTLEILIQGNTLTDNCVGGLCAGIGLERVSGDTGDINVTIGGALTSEGNEISCSDHFATGIRLDNLTNAKIQNNYVHNHFLGGISLGAVTNAEILDNEVSDNQAGIQFDSDCANATVKRNKIHHNNKAGILNGPSIMHASGGVNILQVLDNNKIYLNGEMQGGAGIRIDYAESTNTITGNEIRDNGKAGIRTELAESVTIKNNEIFRNGEAGIRNDGANMLKVQDNNHIYSNGRAGISIEWVNSTNLIDGNNTIRENSRSGIRVISGDLVTVEDNSIYGNGWGGGITNQSAAQLFVNRNEIVNNGYGGIDVRGGIGEITGNTIRANQYGGIGIKTPCTFDIIGNQINGNLRGGIHTGENFVDGTGFVGTPGDARLTIKKNKVYGNGQSGFGGGIDVRHADGDIYNNLVYENHRGGIRFGDWIDEIVNNTVVGNGENEMGGGIIYDDLTGAVNDPPSGCAPDDIPIKNNICTNNEMAGIRVEICPASCPVNRDYNLLCRNNGITTDTCGTSQYCIRRNLGGCYKNANEIFANPLFVNPDNDDYHLQSISGGYPADSPAIGEGEFGVDMGAYGGSDPITQ